MTTTTAPADKARERMEAVVAPIIAAIEAGIDDPVNWKAPWHEGDGDAFNNLNPVTGRSYTAGNRWVLAAETMFRGAETHWATYKHWASLRIKAERGGYDPGRKHAAPSGRL